MRIVSLLMALWSFSQANAADADFTAPATYLEYAAYAVTIGYTSIALHEFGHYLAARSVNAKVTGMRIGLLGGVTDVRTAGLSDDQLNYIYLAGATMNRLNAGWSNLLLEKTREDSMLTRFGGGFYLMNRWMITFLWLQGLYTSNDFTNSRDLWTRDKSSRDKIYAGYAALIALDIWWSWNEVQANTSRFLGHTVTKNESATWQLHVLPTADTFQLEISREY